MAKNFIEDLQKKLSPILEKIPFLSKKNDEDEYEDEDEEADDSDDEEVVSKSSIVGEDKTNPKFDKTANIKIPKLDKVDKASIDPEDDEEGDEVDEDEEVDEEDEEDGEKGLKSQKNRKKIIQLLILLGAIYFIADEFMNSQEEEIVIADPPARPARNKPKKDVVPEPAVEVEEQTAPEEQVTQPTPEPIVEETVTEANEQPVEEVKNEVTEATSKEMDSDVLKMDEISNTATQENIEEPSADIDKVDDSTSFEMTEKENNTEASEKPADETSLDSQLTNIIKSVEKDNEQKMYEYTAPPNYENFGESLVYNCKGKHWACVDKQAHFQCLNNYRWAKQSGNKPECSNSKVLASGKDCRMLQLYNINMVVETPNCN